ncbi:MAG: ABC transporter ATP-binding protein [Chloroflexota bacterium]
MSGTPGATPAGGAPLLAVEDLRVVFRRGRSLGDRVAGRPGPSFTAVGGVSLTIARGETLALVGESGSGKTTTGRAILRLVRAEGGRIVFDGTDVGAATGSALRRLRERIQIVFQDPYSSLNPRMTVGQTIGEVLAVHGVTEPGAARTARVEQLLRDVGLGPEHAGRYPHELSGGQRQRVGIARALAVGPELIVLDEPVSALDVSVQAQIVNLLDDLKEEHGLAYLFIAHDLAVVHHIADRVAVMYLGRIVEEGPVDAIFDAPRHPYTKALLASIPGATVDNGAARHAEQARGELRADRAAQPGCVFRDRCAHRMERCETTPPFDTLGDARRSRCWLDAPDAAPTPDPTPATGG